MLQIRSRKSSAKYRFRQTYHVGIDSKQRSGVWFALKIFRFEPGGSRCNV